MPFFIRAAVEGLRAFPTVNSSVDGTNIVLHKECNIGIAVALDWGLIVPVIKNAEEKNFLGIARTMNDLAERARAKKLKPEEVAESTFSITNPGVFGGLFGLPVINQPNVAILGLGAIEKRPVVMNDAIAIRSMVYLTPVLRSSRRGRRHCPSIHGQGETHARELDRKHSVIAEVLRGGPLHSARKPEGPRASAGLIPAPASWLRNRAPFVAALMSSSSTRDPWGMPPWEIRFVPTPQPLAPEADFAVVGAGFTGLAAAAWLRILDPRKSVVIVESGRIGHGASGRTGGMALGESAAGDLPGLGDVLEGLSGIFAKLRIDCDLSLPGAWEIARKGGLPDSPMHWNDSGTLRVAREVPGGTLDPGKLLGALAKAAEELGAVILENRRVESIGWGRNIELGFEPRPDATKKIHARQVLFATNALSLPLSGLAGSTHPKLTLAALTAPLPEPNLQAIGLAQRKPFYTVDFPYLWGRLRNDNSIVWGAGLVDPPEKSGGLESIDIASAEPSRMFASLEKRIRGLHPALASVSFTHRWGGPILFREGWGPPVFDFHPRSRKGIVLGAFAGHGVALSSYLGAWAAEALLGRRELPDWGKISA